MHHRLLIAGLVITKIRILLERLTYARHMSVVEDTKAACKKRLFFSIPFHILIFQEGDDGLSHR